MATDLSIGTATLKVAGYNILATAFDLLVGDYWMGYTNDWSDPLNWFSGSVPDQFTPVVISNSPAGGRFPIFNSGNIRNCKNLYIEDGASFDLGENESLHIWP
jgi:hypothetical protein